MKGQIFEQVLSNLEDYALILLNAEGTIVSWNRGAERMKGYTEAEVQGKNFEIFYTLEDRSAGLPAKLLEEAKQKGRTQTENWHLDKFDDKFWAKIIITAVHDQDGNTIGFVKITRDLSERVAAEKTIKDYENDLRELAHRSQRMRNVYQLFISELKDYAVIMLDENGVIIDWNKGAEKIKGYSYEEIIGKHFSVFYPLEDRNMMLPETLLTNATKEGRVEHEGWRMKKDGSKFWGNVVITAVYNKDGRLTNFVKITRDRTQTMMTESALRTRIEELEKELSAFKVVE